MSKRSYNTAIESSIMLSLMILVIITMISTRTTMTSAFVVVPQATTIRSSSNSIVVLQSTAESEAERLLRKARELKAAAMKEEESLHASLLNKKEKRDEETDAMIDQLFPTAGASINSVVKRLKTKRHSTDVLMRVVERLHERECLAKGIAHVEATGETKSNFQVVTSSATTSPKTTNPKELQRLEGLIELLIMSTRVIDEEWYNDRKSKGENFYRNHVEADHWTSGDVARQLEDRAQELRREYDEQYQKRVEDYYSKALIGDKKKTKDNEMK